MATNAQVRFQSSDSEEALAEFCNSFYRAHAGAAFRLAYLLLGDAAWAARVVGDALMECIAECVKDRSPDAVAAERRLGERLDRQCVAAALAMLPKRRGRRRAGPERLGGAGLGAALAELAAEERCAFLLHDACGYSSARGADLMRCDPATFHSALFRARLRLTRSRFVPSRRWPLLR